MLTVRDAAELPMLVGRLMIGRHSGTRAGRPYLAIHAVCPWCREVHAHRFAETPGPYQPDAAIRRRAHCRAASRMAGGDYLIIADPLDPGRNERVVEEARRELDRWQANRRMAERLAEARARERSAA